MTARVSMLLKSRASLTCFRACFLPDRDKELSAPPYITSQTTHWLDQIWSIAAGVCTIIIGRTVARHFMAINSNFLKPNRPDVATAFSKILTRPHPPQTGVDFWSWGTLLGWGGDTKRCYMATLDNIVILNGSFTHSTFRWPCIVINSYNKTN